MSKLDDESTVEIRLFDHETGKAFYKRLTERESQIIGTLLMKNVDVDEKEN